MSGLPSIVAVLGLVALNAFFVVAEYSLLTARRGVLAASADRGSRRSAAALRLMDHPVRVISTVQIAISAIAILTGAIGEPLMRDLLGDDLPAAIGFLLAFAIVAYLTVVFGELVPKAISLDRAETLARLIATPIELVGRALSPVVWLLDRSARAVLRLFGAPDAGEARSLTPRTPSSAVVADLAVHAWTDCNGRSHL